MHWIKTHKIVATIGLVVLVAIGFAVFSNGNGDYETVVVERRNIVDDVRVAGTVEADIVSDLGFETSGVVRDVLVDVNDVVVYGQPLVSLTLGTLTAELQAAQADLAIKRAETANTGTNLDAVRQKHDTLVANAWSELLSSDLTAEPNSSTYTQTPPLVSGRYVGSLEGTYKLVIKAGVQNSRTYLSVFGLESVLSVEMSKTGTTPIGVGGLRVSFPDDLTTYQDTTWYIELPNPAGDSYATNYSAYQDAVRERERALADAEADLRAQAAGASIAEAELVRAEAEVARIQALIDQRIIRAPFNGVVAAIDVDPGESVSANARAVSLISAGMLGVAIDLPEVDSVKVFPGDVVSIKLDAVPNETFSGTVASVNRSETLVDGISVYEARIAFGETTDNNTIASGMTADVSIVTDERSNVLAIPSRVVRYRNDGTPYVLRFDGSDTAETDISLGLRGSDGYVEVLAGLDEGDTIAVQR